jgi:hypothetical protein
MDLKLNMKKLILTLSITISSVLLASAQHSVSAAISSSVNSTVTGTPTIDGFSTAADLENGKISSAATFAVKSNRPWKLTTTITTIGAVAIAGGPTTITAPLLPGNVSVGIAATANDDPTTWLTFETLNTGVEPTSGGRGAATVGNNTFSLKYKIIPGFTVDPGTYAVNVTYTVTAQ